VRVRGISAKPDTVVREIPRLSSLKTNCQRRRVTKISDQCVLSICSIARAHRPRRRKRSLWFCLISDDSRLAPERAAASRPSLAARAEKGVRERVRARVVPPLARGIYVNQVKRRQLSVSRSDQESRGVNPALPRGDMCKLYMTLL
jgi:hypothetical protein